MTIDALKEEKCYTKDNTVFIDVYLVQVDIIWKYFIRPSKQGAVVSCVVIPGTLQIVCHDANKVEMPEM